MERGEGDGGEWQDWEERGREGHFEGLQGGFPVFDPISE